ncbi:uncharacterized protein Z518_05282 [Rhinocladiella mackenziei CBS 650.93]|uniref:Dicer-like protein 1 n=1 Tax=Rhinocladiella mackenziei CBS 650.93 TaxID=1442369 RepID=A0A0D2IF23_9EURO|nr:uncharacterized protein Z518_05282 [Rhinocladiella mackenziei CBS 650.93]KIX04414.1 hypothetical protein Z518_05282 [Rhinocladiella mackenziei CBS 650.93]
MSPFNLLSTAASASALATIDFDRDEGDYPTDSEDESLAESQTSDPSLNLDREANKAALEHYVLSQANKHIHQNQKAPPVKELENERSKRIIDQAREYQQELFERAKEENVIAVLDTGSGKTLIAALLIRHFLEQELISRSQGHPPKIVFFLVNSVHLATQQARFLNNNLPENVIPLFGDSGDDLWRRAEWDRIFANNSVVVCTAAVLDQCLMHSYLTMGQISLLVFDEAHHCKKNHPYSRIIRDYYLKWEEGSRPRIFGMTASPVDSKRDIEQVLEDLETLLQSKVVTTDDLSVFDFAPRAEDVIWKYPALQGEFDTELTSRLRRLCGFIDDLSKHFTFSRTASKQLGSWAADRIWKYAIPTSEHRAANIVKKLERSSAYQKWVDNDKRDAALESIHEAISIVQQHSFAPPRLNVEDELASKVRCLYSELTARFSASPATRGLVFVDQKLTAFILCDFFESLSPTNIRPGVLVGVGQIDWEPGSCKDQEAVMEEFRAGLKNLIFATSVAEEGIDIPQCNLVVRFDLYKTPIQYMQSRGRARMKNSIFAHMIEEGNFKEEAEVNYAREQDDYIRRYCRQLSPTRRLGHYESNLKRLIAKESRHRNFKTSTGVVANYGNSLLLLNRYAESLKRIGATSAEIYEEMIDVQENKFRYKVILPETDDERTKAVKGAKGDPQPNKVLAKRSAAWRCCGKLRYAGLLDENLDSIFVKVKPSNLNARIAVSEKKDDYEKKLKPDFWIESGVGSPDLPTKLFITQVLIGPRSLACSGDGLLLLTRSPLPELSSFPVFVDNNVEKYVVFNRADRPVPVTSENIEVLTRFTLNGVFNDVFNKVYNPDATFMSYWLAPQATGDLQGSFEDIVNVDELLRGGAPGRQRWIPATDPDDMRENVKKWCNAFLVDPGNGRFHYFTESVLPGKCIWDPPPESVRKVSKRYKDTIIEFTDSTWRGRHKDFGSFANKYDPNQPVLQAKLVMAGRNFLEKCSDEQKRSVICQIAPQPLEIARVSSSVAAFLQLWPVILHRLEAYLIVQEAFDKLDLTGVPTHFALEAFTHDPTANDGDSEFVPSTQSEPDGRDHSRGAMNYERLEFIGDSLLKMTTTITVFNRTTCNEEGMHCKRMSLLSNSRLCDVASSPRYELFRYIRAGTCDKWRDTWYPEFMELKRGRVIKLTDAQRKHALGKKTIADICEAIIGACIMTSQHLPTEEKFDLGIKAVTKLVEDEDHAITSWKEIAPMYKPPQWSLVSNDPVANDLARRIEGITGYRFNHPRLLRSAFTHSSDQNSPVRDLQRLEFLGDACLDWVCIWWLFSTNPTRDPQWLTEHKMAMVSNRFLASLAVILGFNKLIYASGPALYEEIGNFAVKVLEAYKQEDVKPDFWTRVSSGSPPPKALADLVESYLGAVLVDSGFNFTEIEGFFERHVKWFFEDIEAYDTFANRHPTTHLYRLLKEELGCQKSSPEVLESSSQIITTPPNGDEDNDDDDDGAGDDAVAGVRVHIAWFVHGRMVSVNQGQGVKYAKARASRSALKILGNLGVDEFREKWGCDCVQKRKKDGDGGAEWRVTGEIFK